MFFTNKKIVLNDSNIIWEEVKCVEYLVFLGW